MSNISVEEPAQRARRIGSQVAMAAGALSGLVLAGLSRGNLGLVACIVATTVVVMGFASHAGRIAGAAIAPRPWPMAIAIGALGGLASLLVAAMMAGICGAVWSLRDRASSAVTLWSYVGKPVLAVLSSGAVPALLIGTIVGLTIRGLIGR
jgi:hypothetical protein